MHRRNLFLEFVTRLKLSCILTCWLYDRNYEYFKVASEGRQFVALVRENRWNRLSILHERSILDLDPKAHRNENPLIFLMAAVPYFSLETFLANSAHFVSRGIEFEECLFVQTKTSAEDVYLRYKVSFLVHFCHR